MATKNKLLTKDWHEIREGLSVRMPYSTKEADISEELKSAGCRGKAYVRVYEWREEQKTIFNIHGEVGDFSGFRAAYMLPDIQVAQSLDEAIKKAERMISDVENWHTEKYHQQH